MNEDEKAILRHVRRARGRWVCTDNLSHKAIASLIKRGLVKYEYRPETEKCYIRAADPLRQPIDLHRLVRAQIRPFSPQEDL